MDVRPNQPSSLNASLGRGTASRDPRVVLCALSVQAQFQGLLWHKIMPTVAPGAEITPETLDAIADHITRFSLGGLRGFRSV